MFPPAQDERIAPQHVRRWLRYIRRSAQRSENGHARAGQTKFGEALRGSFSSSRKTRTSERCLTAGGSSGIHPGQLR